MTDNFSSRGKKVGLGGEDHLVMNILAEVLEGDNSLHNYALLMLWASQSNAVPVSAWVPIVGCDPVQTKVWPQIELNFIIGSPLYFTAFLLAFHAGCVLDPLSLTV